MKREEIQNLIREAYEIGCEQGRSEYRISDYCTSASQEESVCAEMNAIKTEFESRTKFKLDGK